MTVFTQRHLCRATWRIRGPEARMPNVSPAAEALGKGKRRSEHRRCGTELSLDSRMRTFTIMHECRASGAPGSCVFGRNPRASAAGLTFSHRPSGPESVLAANCSAFPLISCCLIRCWSAPPGLNVAVGDCRVSPLIVLAIRSATAPMFLDGSSRSPT